MMNLIKKVFPYLKVKELEAENQELKEKLVERQETINKTNAYWKKKLYHNNKKAKES
jgi:hypothetical protein